MGKVIADVVDEKDTPLAYVQFDVLPRPGETMRFEGLERIDPRDSAKRAPALAASYVVERISTVVRVSGLYGRDPNGPFAYNGSATTFVHVKATEVSNG